MSILKFTPSYGVGILKGELVRIMSNKKVYLVTGHDERDSNTLLLRELNLSKNLLIRVFQMWIINKILQPKKIL